MSASDWEKWFLSAKVKDDDAKTLAAKAAEKKLDIGDVEFWDTQTLDSLGLDPSPANASAHVLRNKILAHAKPKGQSSLFPSLLRSRALVLALSRVSCWRARVCGLCLTDARIS
jgi:hypothetical protein